MLQEFRKFAMGGNVVDMAVGIIIDDAFGTIVRSRVDDGLMLPFGLLLGSRLRGNLHHLRGCTKLSDLYDTRAGRQTSPRLSSP